MPRIRSMFVAVAVSTAAALPSQEAAPAAAVPPKAAATRPAPVYDEAADARADVARAVAASERENRRVLIQWGANWCHWCTLLATRMRTDRDLSRKLQYEYDVIKIDVGHFDKNLDLAKDLGAEFKAIPFLTILDRDGKAIVQQNTEPFETGTGAESGHDPKKLLAFLTEHQAAYLDAGKVRAAALAQAQKDGKRVFLHFGAPWCPWCHRLDDWMRGAAVAPLLGRAFVDLKIDTDRMVGGKQMLADERSKAGSSATGIPWIAFLDADGAQLATSDGPAGNVGFPAKDDEIAWFDAMLGKANANLTDADIGTLHAELVRYREAMKGGQGH